MTTKLKLSIATGNYDLTRPLVDGEVPIDGVEPNRHVLDRFLGYHYD